MPRVAVAPMVWWGEKGVGQLDGVRPELIAGHACLVCYRSFWDQKRVVQLSPHFAGSCLWKKRILSVQAEAWQVLSVFQQVPACLLGFVQTCGPAKHTIQKNILIASIT